MITSDKLSSIYGLLYRKSSTEGPQGRRGPGESWRITSKKHMTPCGSPRLKRI